MRLDPSRLLQLIREAGRPVGLMELLHAAALHPGEQTELKRTLRELVRSGGLQKVGKRFSAVLPVGEPPSHAPPQGLKALRRDLKQPKRPSGGRNPSGKPESSRGGQPPRSSQPKQDLRSGRSGPPPRSGQAQRPAQALRPPSGAPTIEGILHVHRDGFGFVHPVTGEGENIFVPAEEAARALDHDRVRVEVVPGRGGRTAGRIVQVTSRLRARVVGTYRLRGGSAYVEPLDTSLNEPVQVPPTQLARDGDMVKVQLGLGADLIRSGGLFGEVVGSLGQEGDASAEVLSIAYSQGFSDEFPAEVMEEADAVRLTVSDEEAKGEDRRDLRKLPLVTIDGIDARDFDDAVYAEQRGEGWRLIVAIADVTHYVRLNTALDAEALHRATSVYLPDRVLPMLPERLSNGICSLRPKEDRLCMVSDLFLSPDGQLEKFELYPAVMNSAARCTYEQVQELLDGKEQPQLGHLQAEIFRLRDVARLLRKRRKARGAIDFDLPEHKVVLGPDGMPKGMEKRERFEAHKLIEDCMLASNEAVARYFQELELPSVYRFHGEPDPEKLQAFAQLAAAHGFFLGKEGEVSSRDLNQFLAKLEGHAEQRALNQLLLRSMMQAVYSSEQVGHYGLAAENYLHFTSPIRRYPDLLVHRLLKAHWKREGKGRGESELDRETDELEAKALHASDRERAAMKAEREVVSYYAAVLMRDRVGEQFEATVAALTDFGFFVEPDGVGIEGLVKGETLGPDYELDAKTHTLVYPNGRRVRVGQRLTVVLSSVSLERRQIDFQVVNFEGELPRQAEADSGLSGHPGYDRLRAQAKKGGEAGTSPHPGFDRLRALGTRGGGGGGRAGGGRGGRGGEGGGRSGAAAKGGGRDGGSKGQGGGRSGNGSKGGGRGGKAGGGSKGGGGRRGRR